MPDPDDASGREALIQRIIAETGKGEEEVRAAFANFEARQVMPRVLPRRAGTSPFVWRMLGELRGQGRA